MTCIELFGCTSAGKSTLITRILRFCQDQGIDVSQGEDFLLKQFGLDKIVSTTARAILVNLISLPVTMANSRKYHLFLSFAFRTIIHRQISLREKVYLGRNILKCVGIYEIAKTQANNHQTILLDEGPLHSANTLFVNVPISSPEVDLSEFVRLVPFPDAAVYLREREDVIIQRTMERGHKRIRNGTPGEVAQFVQSAIALFERLSQEPVVQSKLFIVNGHEVTHFLRDSTNPLIRFVFHILRAGLYEPTIDAGKTDQSIHVGLDQSYEEIEIDIEDET
jgi:hypothetical protein